MMILGNKFNIGDEVFYPAADLRTARLIRSKITAIVITNVDGKKVISYQTKESPYSIEEVNLSKKAGVAKKRLITLIHDQGTRIAQNINDAMKAVEDAKPEDITFDGLAENETTTEE